MKKKILMILPLFLVMFFAGQVVHAQSYVSSGEAITILNNELSDLNSDLQQLTEGTQEYQLLAAKIELYHATQKLLIDGNELTRPLIEGIELTLPDLSVSRAVSFADAQNGVNQVVPLKQIYLDLNEALQN